MPKGKFSILTPSRNLEFPRTPDKLNADHLVHIANNRNLEWGIERAQIDNLVDKELSHEEVLSIWASNYKPAEKTKAKTRLIDFVVCLDRTQIKEEDLDTSSQLFHNITRFQDWFYTQLLAEPEKYVQLLDKFPNVTKVYFLNAVCFDEARTLEIVSILKQRQPHSELALFHRASLTEHEIEHFHPTIIPPYIIEEDSLIPELVEVSQASVTDNYRTLIPKLAKKTRIVDLTGTSFENILGISKVRFRYSEGRIHAVVELQNGLALALIPVIPAERPENWRNTLAEAYNTSVDSMVVLGALIDSLLAQIATEQDIKLYGSEKRQHVEYIGHITGKIYLIPANSFLRMYKYYEFPMERNPTYWLGALL